jgi:TnpA family transposase
MSKGEDGYNPFICPVCDGETDVLKPITNEEGKETGVVLACEWCNSEIIFRDTWDNVIYELGKTTTARREKREAIIKTATAANERKRVSDALIEMIETDEGVLLSDRYIRLLEKVMRVVNLH